MTDWIRACPVDDIEVEDLLRFDHGDRTFAVYRHSTTDFSAPMGFAPMRMSTWPTDWSLTTSSGADLRYSVNPAFPPFPSPELRPRCGNDRCSTLERKWGVPMVSLQYRSRLRNDAKQQTDSYERNQGNN